MIRFGIAMGLRENRWACVDDSRYEPIATDTRKIALHIQTHTYQRSDPQLTSQA